MSTEDTSKEMHDAAKYWVDGIVRGIETPIPGLIKAVENVLWIWTGEETPEKLKIRKQIIRRNRRRAFFKKLMFWRRGWYED